MQFLIIGLDGKDKEAPARRQAVRPAHIKLGEELLASGNYWYGAALLDDDGNMNGSMFVMDFPNRQDLQKWLSKEPYVTGGVWKTIEVKRCNVREPWQFNRPKSFYENQTKYN